MTQQHGFARFFDSRVSSPIFVKVSTTIRGEARRGGARRAPVIHAPRGGTRIRRPPVKDSFVAYHALEVTSRPTDLIADTPCCSRVAHGMEFEPAHFHPIFFLFFRVHIYIYILISFFRPFYGALTPEINITSKQLFNNCFNTPFLKMI